MKVDALAALGDAIEQFAAIDPEMLDDTQLHDVVVGLGRLSTRLEAAWVASIHHWDTRRVWAADGSKASGARLARETSLPEGNAKRLVRRGRQLTSMPITREAYRRGELNGAHVDLVATCDREWANQTFAESEELLVGNCRTPWFSNAVKATRFWQMMADRDQPDPDPGRDSSRLSVSQGWDGEVKFDGIFDPIGGEIVKAEVDRLAEQFRLQDAHEGIERRPAERRAAALIEMAIRSASAPADGLRPRPLITVTMGIDHFATMCQTAAGTVVSPGIMIPWLSDADIERMVYEPPKRKIEASHRRSFSAVMAKFIRLRDQVCQHPSCNEPGIKCDIDHIEPRSCGGITCICNGQLLCAYHNRILKAEHDRRRALQHRHERDDERHQTDCLLAQPEPCRFCTDSDEDAGLPLARIPDPENPAGWIRVDELRRRAS